MWKINDQIKVSTPSDLIMDLTVLMAKPAPIMFSFNIPDNNIIYLINVATFPSYDPEILQQAKNIKAWQKII